MFTLLFLTSLVAVGADIDLSTLKPRDVVQLVLQDDSSVVAGVVAATADTVEVMNLETQTVRTFSPGDLKAIRSGLSDRQIVRSSTRWQRGHMRPGSWRRYSRML